MKKNLKSIKNKLKILILSGLPASGKSTYALDQVKNSNGKIKRISKDDLRAMMDNKVWSRENEKNVLKVRDTIIEKMLENNYSIIIDDTNFAKEHENRIREIARGKAEVEVKFFDVPLEVCIERDSKRENSVGEKVITDMYNKYVKDKAMEEVKMESKVIFDDKLPKAIICDLDNTLAIMKNRSPFDWHRVGEDEVDEVIRALLHAYMWQGYTIIIMSGRDGCCCENTEDWLINNEVDYDYLFMRPEGNNEKDSIIKERLFMENINGKFNVEFILDDRNSVVKKWRSMGLKCFQVAEGNF